MYYSLLPKIKNAGRARKENFLTPFSKSDFAVSKLLAENGYLKEVKKKTIGKKSFLEIKMIYRDNRPAVTDFKILSKPSRHIYISYRMLKPVRQGYGLGVLSTPHGIMSGKQARKNKVGGEYLFQVW